jgi:hypothetical protein
MEPPISKISYNHPHHTRCERPKYEIADILKLYLPEYLKNHKLSPEQLKAVYDIMNCRTSALGFHKLKCDKCNFERIEYDSCRNRHCPKCQGTKRLQWVEDRLSELLPVPYYHSVFTMPHTLNVLALYNKTIIYDIFLQSCGQTLKDFAGDPKYLGAKVGFVGILHTWGQQLWPHIHAHFIIPGGGISEDGKRWINLPYRKKFLFPVKAMSRRMRMIFSGKLQKAYDNGELVFPDELRHLKEDENFKRFINKIAWDKWINYVKKPFSSPERVVKYIGRYTHRAAVSNHRILNITDGKVTFKYKEYKDGNVTPKIMTVKAEEFIRRFLLHILPKGFKKIRYFGFMCNGLRKKCILLAKDLLNVIVTETDESISAFHSILEKLFKCPNCNNGILSLTESFPVWQLKPG